MVTTLYKGYDQAGLDAQLNLRARWPEYEQYFARWAEESAAVRSARTCRLDLAYGESPGERLDLFLPQATGPAPLLVFIHGGYWQFLDKNDFSFLAPGFLDAGIAFASVNYDLAPAARVEEIVQQVRHCLAWLYAEGAELGYDPNRIFVAGHSAGGHLAAMSLVEGWADRLGLPGDLVKGACAVSGIYELEPMRLSYHQEVLALDPEEVERVSPLRCRPAGTAELICAVGDEETDLFLDQQAELAAAWGGAGQSLRAIELEARNHFTAVDALGEEDHVLFQVVKDLILQTV